MSRCTRRHPCLPRAAADWLRLTIGQIATMCPLCRQRVLDELTALVARVDSVR